MRSGFCFEDEGLLYMVNSGWYSVDDDKECFKLSCMYHKVNDKEISDTYEIKRANVRYIDNHDVAIEFSEDGEAEFRVYEVYEK